MCLLCPLLTSSPVWMSCAEYDLNTGAKLSSFRTDLRATHLLHLETNNAIVAAMEVCGFRLNRYPCCVFCTPTHNYCFFLHSLRVCTCVCVRVFVGAVSWQDGSINVWNLNEHKLHVTHVPSKAVERKPVVCAAVMKSQASLLYSKGTKDIQGGPVPCPLRILSITPLTPPPLLFACVLN